VERLSYELERLTFTLAAEVGPSSARGVIPPDSYQSRGEAHPPIEMTTPLVLCNMTIWIGQFAFSHMQILVTLGLHISATPR
jgi:hypothetical protein